MNSNRITLLISSLAGGGAEGVCVSVANGLANNGWHVDLVVLHLNNAVYDSRLSESINLISLRVDHARYSFIPIKKYLKENKVEKILVFSYELAIILVLLRKLTRVPFTIFARNINTISQSRKAFGGFWKTHVMNLIFDTLYCQVDHVINQCRSMELDLLDVYPSLIGRTSFIYNPVNQDVERVAAKTDDLQIEREDYLLCVGRLELQKAFHYAIKGFSSIAKEFPGLRLKIVGQGSLESELKQCAVDLGVSDRVDFEGFQKDLISYYQKARATLLTSLYEGFPNVLIESITLGTPVVAFSCPNGPSEIVQDQVNGLLVENENTVELASKLRTVLNFDFDPNVVMQTAESFYSENIITIYENILCSRV